MHNHKFHSFPIHSFPKEYMLGTGGNLEYFLPGSPILSFTGTGGNGWERVNFSGINGVAIMARRLPIAF
jgi:hypothetical protein